MPIETITQLKSRFRNQAWITSLDTDALIEYAKGNVSSAADPTTADISTGQSQLWFNSVSGELREWSNVGGVLYKSRAYTAVPTFVPSSLFAGAVAGGFWNFADKSNMWKDTGATSAVTSHGDTVARVNDLSGNDNYMYQSTSGRQGAFQSVAGDEFLKLDGVDDFMDVSINQPANYTVMIAFRLRTLTGSQCICGSVPADAGSIKNWGVILSRDASAKMEWAYGDATTYRYGDTVEDVFVPGEPMVVEHSYAAGNANPTLYKSTTALTPANQVGTAIASATGTNTFKVGRLASAYTFYASVDLYGAIAIAKVLDSTERAAVRTYFADWMPE